MDFTLISLREGKLKEKATYSDSSSIYMKFTEFTLFKVAAYIIALDRELQLRSVGDCCPWEQDEDGIEYQAYIKFELVPLKDGYNSIRFILDHDNCSK
jgi:hypothetical protein